MYRYVVLRYFCIKHILFLHISVFFYGFIPEQIFQGAIDYKRGSTADTAAKWHQRGKRPLHKLTMLNLLQNNFFRINNVAFLLKINYFSRGILFHS